jgi:hypothetical protein
MARKLGAARDRIVNAVVGVELRAMLVGLRDSLARQESTSKSKSADVARRLIELADLVSAQSRVIDAQSIQAAELQRLLFERSEHDAWLETVRMNDRDNVAGLRAQLERIRASDDYKRSTAVEEPLVSVRIASYQRTDELIDVAIASVLAQTYQRFEIVVVNDGPNPATRAAIQKLGDPRIRYDEFSRRNVYPEDRHSRWMVAGSPGMNRGANLATGEWIAPLDEDDSFTADHIEKLLALARSEHVELAYGALQQKNLVTSKSSMIWSFPPEISRFSFQSALYLRALNTVFQYDESSWTVKEPGDWNLIRRMTAAGVTMAATDDLVGVMNQIPYTHKVEN